MNATAWLIKNHPSNQIRKFYADKWINSNTRTKLWCGRNSLIFQISWDLASLEASKFLNRLWWARGWSWERQNRAGKTERGSGKPGVPLHREISGRVNAQIWDVHPTVNYQQSFQFSAQFYFQKYTECQQVEKNFDLALLSAWYYLEKTKIGENWAIIQNLNPKKEPWCNYKTIQKKYIITTSSRITRHPGLFCVESMYTAHSHALRW